MFFRRKMSASLPKNFVEGTFSVSIISGIEKVYG